MSQQSIFTNCYYCSRVKLISTPCSCESKVKLSLDEEIYQVVSEYQPVKAIDIVHIINARVKPRIRTTYGQVQYRCSKNKHIVSDKAAYAEGHYEVKL